MGKKKNKNKISGAEKTAAKTEKKLANKLKKELATLGEEDIAKVVAEIEREEAKRSAATEKILKEPPSPRAFASLTPHPTNNELIMFGGEFHDGKQTEVYNELLFYNPEKDSWRQVKAPGAPPPRSAHQAVATSANGGELWVFGGEFTSPTETQFHHYKDLWRFSLAEKKWEKVVSANGPSSRSGHRMILLDKKLFVFGGYADDGRQCRYFDDVYTFCTQARQWTKLSPVGKGPSPRAACVMLPAGEQSLLIYGGFSRSREGKTEHTYTHTDMFRLTRKGESWQWRTQNGGPLAPPPRAGLAAALSAHNKRGYVFGGVTDVEETEEDIQGEMSDELKLLDLDTGKWHNVTLKSEEERPSAPGESGDGPSQKMDTEEKPVTVVQTDEVFTMKLGGAPAATVSVAPAARPTAPRGGPSPRMSAMMTIQRSHLYVYGGLLEKNDKQFYLSDMFSLDLHKLTDWRTIIAQVPWPTDSDTETDSSDSEESPSDDSGDEL